MFKGFAVTLLRLARYHVFPMFLRCWRRGRRRRINPIGLRLGRSPRVILALLLLFAMAACAKRPGIPEADTALPFPEVAEVTFQGNKTFGRLSLLQVMLTKPAPFYLPWKRGESFNPATLEADLLRLKKFYFDRGYLETVVQLGEVLEDGRAKTVQVTIVINEGPLTRVAGVQLVGDKPPELPTRKTLLSRLPLRPKRPLTKAAFDKSKELLLGEMQKVGYARARIVPQTEVAPRTHEASVTFRLIPGERTTFGRITLRGAQAVKERAIRRQLEIREGDWYSSEGLSSSIENVYQLGMFQAVTPRMLNREESGAPLDLEIELREQKPRSLEFGIGFSTVERFRLQSQWTHRNLLGGAERLLLSGKVSSIEQSLEARLQLPYFLKPRTSFTQTLSVRNEQDINTDPFGISDALFSIKDAQPAFDLLSISSESRVTRRLIPHLDGFTGLELSYNDFRNVDPTALAEAGLEAAEDNILFIQFAGLEWNTRDNRLNPTRGLFIRGQVGHSNTSLLSDVDFIKLEWEVRHYQPLGWGLILATRLKQGTIQPYGASEEIPFNARFFAGGPGSVRGFSKNRLGPLDANGNPLGGESLLEGSVELRFPLALKFSGALFVDFGNVFRNAFTFRLDEIRYAVGPGIRYQTPIGPLRLDIGVVIDRRADEDFGRVEFSIGQAF